MVSLFSFDVDLLSFIQGIAAGIPLGVIAQVMGQDYFTRRRNKENRRIKAKDVFFEAVISELSVFLLTRMYWPTGIDGLLLQSVPKLQIAMQTYRPHVRGKYIASFDKAWEGFVGFCKQRKQDSDYATGKMYEKMPGENPVEILQEHINHLLSFAEL